MALAQGQGAHAQGPGAHRRGGAAAGRAGRPRRALAVDRGRPSTSRAPSAGRSACWSPRALTQELRRARGSCATSTSCSRPGLRLGLLGANGSGKTTLLRLLAGLEPPDAGTVERAPQPAGRDVRPAPLAPRSRRLAASARSRRTATPWSSEGRAIHVAGWAKRFLFRSEQLETPVGRLSGGEQARVLIARLMLEPADLLLLDEPTNDLDIPTLEVLEESLLEFPGALVLVTHDRYLLDRVSTRILALDGRGRRDRRTPTTRSGRRPGARRGRAARRQPRKRTARTPDDATDRPPPASSATTSSASGTRWRRASSRPRAGSQGCQAAAADPGGRVRPRGAPARHRRAGDRAGRGRPALRALGRARGEGGGVESARAPRPPVSRPDRQGAREARRRPEGGRARDVGGARQEAGRPPVGNILLIGSSGSGKTTLMRAVEELLASEPGALACARRSCASTPTCWARRPSRASPARSCCGGCWSGRASSSAPRRPSRSCSSRRRTASCSSTRWTRSAATWAASRTSPASAPRRRCSR